MNRIGFDDLQLSLGAALEANQPHSGIEHVLVVLPSYSVGESLLSHYADRIPALEHRFLLGSLILGPIESCEVVFVTCAAPEVDVLDYYVSLLRPEHRESGRGRFRLLTVPDASARPVAAKLLERSDLLDALRESFAGRLAFIEPWNVTEAEVEVACRLGAPLNGTSPSLRPLGFKSAGRRLFARVGVPKPLGVEDVHTVDDVLDAIATIRSGRPAVPAVVIKHDDSGAGDGNAKIDLVTPLPGSQGLRARIEALPRWYLDDLERGGGVVEEWIQGDWVSSPSAQVDIHPSGRVVVLATHEQVLGGDDGQVYMGCRFPAAEAYAATIAAHAVAVGEELADRGAVGRVSVDFAAARDAAGQWVVAALEINLRKGGTTHPYSTLRSLVPGRYDAEAARWVASDGSARAYVSTDNAIDPKWQGRSAASVIRSILRAGLEFDHDRGSGIVLHMLSSLAIDGRFGLTAIGHTSHEAQDLFQRALGAVAG